MSKTKSHKTVFLLDQTLSQLAVKKADQQYRILCGDVRVAARTEKKMPSEANLWRPRSRTSITAKAASLKAPRRVALMCDAGLGKTTNMQWLEYAIASQTNSRQLPFLFHLDWQSDIDRLPAEIKNPGTLLDWMAMSDLSKLRFLTLKTSR